MSDTTWKISHTHQRVGEECTCGGFRSALARDHSRHIAEVTEAAVREQVAREIEAERERNETVNVATTATGLYIRSTIAASYNNAAYIARGGRAVSYESGITV